MSPHPEIDLPIWTERRSWGAPRQKNPSTRDGYSRDRSRVIHSASFRRLQAKTQVLGLHESDFYRTRLTHSLEVAQIGSGIVEHMQRNSDCATCRTWLPSPYLIEAICMAHDIGHPPFGHGGEVALNFMMRNHGGFEGNGQTLRILAKLGEHSERDGQDLTRRTLLGVLKYPVLYREVVRKDEDYLRLCRRSDYDFKTIDMQPWLPPKSIFDEEAAVRDWILSPFSATDQSTFIQAKLKDGAHGQAQFHALDTAIMDIADDIAYGVHDLEDAIAMGLIHEKLWQEQVMSQVAFTHSGLFDAQQITQWLFAGNSRSLKRGISHLVGAFIHGVYLKQQQLFEHPLLDCQALLTDEAAAALHVLKGFVWDHVISIPEVKSFEYKGQVTVMELFRVLWANPERLLPRSRLSKLNAADNEQVRMRLLCDYVAGMTDDYATRVYAKLFSPYYGSIFDRL
ncbi:MAG: deoxyguanosinetriphosphate triphosphohydrolase family protein [Thiotrichales bacterium]|jgi:dGTPase|nr:deoxyguanosinetriphosphate triphosphohydrolase family protein [Thiotrichales bacterium]